MIVHRHLRMASSGFCLQRDHRERRISGSFCKPSKNTKRYTATTPSEIGSHQTSSPSILLRLRLWPRGSTTHHDTDTRAQPSPAKNAQNWNIAAARAPGLSAPGAGATVFMRFLQNCLTEGVPGQPARGVSRQHTTHSHVKTFAFLTLIPAEQGGRLAS